MPLADQDGPHLFETLAQSAAPQGHRAAESAGELAPSTADIHEGEGRAAAGGEQGVDQTRG